MVWFIAALSFAPIDDPDTGRAFAQLRLARSAYRMAGDLLRELIRAYQ